MAFIKNRGNQNKIIFFLCFEGIVRCLVEAGGWSGLQKASL